MSSPTREIPISGSVSVKDRARQWQAAAACSPTTHSVSPPNSATDTLAKDAPPPPSFEEIVAMEEAGKSTNAADGETCTTPSNGDSSPTPTKRQQQQHFGTYSRQVSRVSGTGRTTRAVTPRSSAAVTPRSSVAVTPRSSAAAKAAAAAASAAAAAEEAAAAAVAASSASRGRRREPPSPKDPPQKPTRSLAGSKRSSDYRYRRSISVDNQDRRQVQVKQGSSRGQHQIDARNNRRGGLSSNSTTTSNSAAESRGRRLNNSPSVRFQQPRYDGENRQPRANGGRGGRKPYAPLGTPSASVTNGGNRANNQSQWQHQQPGTAEAIGGELSSSPSPSVGVGAGAGTGGGEKEDVSCASTLRRHNSAPDMGIVGDLEQEGEVEVEKNSPLRTEARPVLDNSPVHSGWGGGLPPTCGPAAARAAAAALAAQQPAKRGSGGSNARYSFDRESFARTLNEEELDEVWKGLGEGVSQRGHGSEVAFDAGGDNVPSSPAGTGVSGAFPVLTANVLEKHDQLAEEESAKGGGSSGEGGAGAACHANVMPMPKNTGDKAMEDMENGTTSRRDSSKKGDKESERSGGSRIPALLGAIFSTVVLVLWLAHLLVNVFLLGDVVLDQYIWALCLLPGVLGVLLSLHSCRKNHRGCKPVAEEEDAGRAHRRAPHPCALPTHTFLLLSVVVSLVMHASAMLFCEKDMLLLFDEDMLEPLCGDSSLTLPLILDGVLLSVASLKASSLCWAWALN